MEGYFGGWAASQEKNIALIRESFPAQEQFYLLLQERELRGLPILESVAAQLYDGSRRDPSVVFCADQSYVTERNLEDGSWVMTVHLPYMRAADLSVTKQGDDLILGVRNERRRFRLTEQLSRRNLKAWTYENGCLQIVFEQ